MAKSTKKRRANDYCKLLHRKLIFHLFKSKERNGLIKLVIFFEAVGSKEVGPKATII